MAKRKTILPIIISLLFVIFSFCDTYAQKEAFKISGAALDSTEAPIVGATVLLLHAQDSVMEHYAITDVDGLFELKTKQAGHYHLQISFVGYGTFKRAIQLVADEPIIKLGNIVLSPNQQLLDGVTITDTFVPIVMNGDTVEYLADAFKTVPDAVVEDLLKKLPGVEVEKDGTIKVGGEKVDKVLVDGKEFFGQDNKVATQNLPANIVEKVQVYDKASATAQFTGITDGQESKAINLKLKADRNRGMFGSVRGSYAYPDRYEGHSGVYYFDDKSRMNAQLSANNTKQDFSSTIRMMQNNPLENSDLPEDVQLGALLGQIAAPTGLSQNYMGNLSLNREINKKLTLKTQLSNDFHDSNKEQQSVHQNFTTAVPFETNRRLFQDSKTNQLAGKFNLTYNPSTEQELTIDADLKRRHFTDQQDQNEVSQIPMTNQSISGLSRYLLQGQVPTWRTNLSYRQKLQKKGRYLTIDLHHQGGLDKQTNNIDNRQAIHNNDSLTNTTFHSQLQTSDMQNVSSKATINYSEPIGEAKYLGIRSTQTITQTEQIKNFEDFDNDSDRYIFNPSISSHLSRTAWQSQVAGQFKISKQSFHLITSLAYEHNRLNNLFQVNEQQDLQTYHYLLPSFSVKKSFENSSNLQLNYTTRTLLPNLAQLQPIINNTNPLFTQIGNPNLRPEYMHQLSGNFMRYNTFQDRLFFVGMHANYVDQKIIQHISIDANLKQQAQPVNFGDSWAVGVNFNINEGETIKNIPIQLSWQGDITYQRNPQLTNNVRSIANMTFINNAWELGFNDLLQEKVSILFTYDLGVNTFSYPSNSLLNQVQLDHTFQTSVDVIFSEKLYFMSEYRLNTNNMQEQIFHYWDASLHYTFWKKRMKAFISANNLLNQTNVVRQTGSETQVSQTTTNRLGRVVLFGFEYKIKAFRK